MNDTAASALPGRRPAHVDKAIAEMVDDARQRALADLRRAVAERGDRLRLEVASNLWPSLGRQWETEKAERRVATRGILVRGLLFIVFSALVIFQAWSLVSAPPRHVEPGVLGYAHFGFSFVTSMIGVAACWIAFAIFCHDAWHQLAGYVADWRAGYPSAFDRFIPEHSKAIGMTETDLYLVEHDRYSEEPRCVTTVVPLNDVWYAAEGKTPETGQLLFHGHRLYALLPDPERTDIEDDTPTDATRNSFEALCAEVTRMVEDARPRRRGGIEVIF